MSGAHSTPVGGADARQRVSLVTAGVLVTATQLSFGTAASGVELGLLPIWIWLICTAALLALAVGMWISVLRTEAPRRWRPVWIALAALVLNVLLAMAWAPALR